MTSTVYIEFSFVWHKSTIVGYSVKHTSLTTNSQAHPSLTDAYAYIYIYIYNDDDDCIDKKLSITKHHYLCVKGYSN